MICKVSEKDDEFTLTIDMQLVTHGRDRAEALDRMRDALDNYVIRGVGECRRIAHTDDACSR
jgi:acetyl/propionyl-CoA carboxylase alpha subunit